MVVQIVKRIEKGEKLYLPASELKLCKCNKKHQIKKGDIGLVIECDKCKVGRLLSFG